MSMSATYPDLRVEWKGEFVRPEAIIKDLKIMQENETEQKSVEETNGAEAGVEANDEAKPEESTNEGGLKAPDQGVEAVNA